MLRHQQRKIRIIRLFLRTLIAVPVHRHDAVRVLIDHNSMRIHAEGTHLIFEFFRAVDDLALIQFICQMRKDHSRNFHPDPYIHTVGLGFNIQFLTHLLHPFAAASSYGYDALITLIGSLFTYHTITPV